MGFGQGLTFFKQGLGSATVKRLSQLLVTGVSTSLILVVPLLGVRLVIVRVTARLATRLMAKEAFIVLRMNRSLR